VEQDKCRNSAFKRVVLQFEEIIVESNQLGHSLQESVVPFEEIAVEPDKLGHSFQKNGSC
jgi:hypothetical protein